MSVFGQPQMLERQRETISIYSKEALEQLTVVIVDDHGDPPVTEFDVPCPVQVWRVDEDIPWNQMGARNLGITHSPPGPCILMDPDMVIDPMMMDTMLAASKKLARGTYYRMMLKHTRTSKIDGSSPNFHMIYRDDFLEAGGYDEDYRGNKGWSDVQMLDVLNAHYRHQHRKDLWAWFFSVDDVPDAMVTTLDRSTAANRKMRLRKQGQARKLGWRKWVETHKGPNLRFKYHQVL